jgi:hypothetical protein
MGLESGMAMLRMLWGAIKDRKNVQARLGWESRQLKRFISSSWFYLRQRRDIRPLSMLPESRLADLVRRVDEVIDRGVEGAFVECGTWRGGAAFLMAKRAADRSTHQPVWMFDSFEGLPPPQEIDGPAAIAWSRDVSSPLYFDNCYASIGQVQADAVRLGVDGRVRIVKGWFEESLPHSRREIGPIALLRIDGDWYDSVRVCLDTLFDLVVPGGVVIVDDYYDWDGAARAVHDFLSERNAAVRLRSTHGPRACAYIAL